MTEVKKPVSNWLTGLNVSTQFPSAGLKGLPEGFEKKDVDEEQAELQELQGEDVEIDNQSGAGVGADGQDVAEEEDDGRPNISDSKPDWVEFRESQGYTAEELEGLTKEQLQELPDR